MIFLFVQCVERVFKQTVGIPKRTNCAPLLHDLFLHSYGVDLIADLIQKKTHGLARFFNLSFRYLVDVLSLKKNPSFEDFIHRIYPKELTIKDTTDTVKSASYLDLHL